MSFDVPDDRNYLASHEWVTTDEPIRIGISAFAQDELGDVVFVELPDEGDRVSHDEPFGVVESIKAVSDLHAPISGEVVAVNDDLRDQPELVNEDPYGDGWLIEVEPSDESEFAELMGADEYEEQIA